MFIFDRGGLINVIKDVVSKMLLKVEFVLEGFMYVRVMMLINIVIVLL